MRARLDAAATVSPEFGNYINRIRDTWEKVDASRWVDMARQIQANEEMAAVKARWISDDESKPVDIMAETRRMLG